MKLRLWLRLWCSSLVSTTEGEARALARLREVASAQGVDLRGVSDAELRQGVLEVAAEFHREGLDAHLLAAGYEHVGPEFVLLL